MKKLSVAVLLLIVSSISSAQQPKPSSSSEAAKKEAANLWIKAVTLEAQATVYALDPDNHKDDAGAAEELANVYRKALLYSDNAGSFSGEIYARFLGSKAMANSAPQVSQVANEAAVKFQFLLSAQNQVIIDQNKRIIELLERIAKKP